MNQIISRLRAATKSDCRKIAQLYSISSDGVADYVWSKLAEPGEQPLTVGERRYAREDTDFSYQNCILLENEIAVLGMLVAFGLHVDPDYLESDPVLAPYAKLEEDNSYYICGVALFPEYRNHGLGTLLMQEAEKQAQLQGYSKTSLIVFEQNEGAKALYERLGYTEVAREPVYTHPMIHFDGDALLMVKDI